MLQLILGGTSGPLPTSTFTLVKHGQNLGIIQIRHRPSRSDVVPPGFESHVYYEIEPTHRHQGNGREILRLGLVEARRLGLKEVIMTCYESNIPSRRIIEANGGLLQQTCLIPEHQGEVMFLKYKILLV